MHHLRSQYFVTFGCLGAIVPFQPILLHEIGLTAWHLGLILATPGLAALISPVVLAYIADRHLSSRKLLAFGNLMSALALSGLYLSNTFWIVVALTLIINLLYAPALALLDVVSLYSLRNNLTQDLTERDFPLIRRWGSVGFIAPAVLLFLTTHLFEAQPKIVYLIGAALSFSAAYLSFRLPDVEPAAREARTIPTLTAARLLAQPPLAALTLGLFVAAIGLSMFYFIMPRYLQELGLSMENAGLVITLGVLWEIALLSVAPQILERWGIRGTTISGFGLTALRFLLLAVVPSIFMATATQILHAPLVLVLAVVIPVVFTQAATPEVRNSLLGLASSVYNGLSRVIGPPIAGAILTHTSGSPLEQLQFTFMIGAIFCGIGTLILVRGFKPELDHSAAIRSRTNQRDATNRSPEL